MKYKIYILFTLAFLAFATATTNVMADTAEVEPSSEVQTSAIVLEDEVTTSIEETTTARTVKKVNKTIKVKSKYNLKKALKITNSQAKKLSFKTSNKKVAKVSKTGTVKGVKYGKAKITVTSKEDRSSVAIVNLKVNNKYTESQLKYLASIIYCEARGECYAGKKAVGIVVMNRVKSDEFPNTISEVIYQPGQFTPASNGSLKKALARYDKGKMNASCIKAAKEVLNGDTTVKYKGKTHNLKGYLFFSRYVYNCRLQIQNHMFK